ncbi:MAG: 2-oxoglutarate dehydrogenase E1 component [Candidatus Comchoanobacterales bacterium]
MEANQYKKMKQSDFLGQLPLDALEEMYQIWLQNPDAVGPGWKHYFEYSAQTGAIGVLDETRQSMQSDVLQSGTLDASVQHRPEIDNKAINPLSEKKNTSTIGFEYFHIDDAAKRQWWSNAAKQPIPKFNKNEALAAYQKLFSAAELERYLGSQFVGQKRFSLEGNESLIYCLDRLLCQLAQASYKDIVLGMAHRGRLNVMINTLGMPVKDLVNMFRGDHHHDETTGDVKYHLGYSSDVHINNEDLHVSLACNPSHLESIAPVVLGNVRARQDMVDQSIASLHSAGIIIHGDAAVMGQGVVFETSNLSRLKGYDVGGTIHIVVNNQIGFTTDPDDSRSTTYCTAVARAFECPIMHVNGNDIEAVRHAAALASQYKTEFNEDVFIDLIGFRRFGHNEADDPTFTQPIMYQNIHGQDSVDKVFKQHIEKLCDSEDLNQIEHNIKMAIRSGEVIPKLSELKLSARQKMWQDYTTQVDLLENASITISNETVDTLRALMVPPLPEGFSPHRQVTKLMEHRQSMMQGQEGINWALGEAIGMTVLLMDGYNIRMAGQDVQRGTFSQRHACYHDQKTNAQFWPVKASLKQLDGTGELALYNSPLSEFACLGFEYGYSETHPKTLTIWEAQFGDFANGAQIIIDQFITSGWQKWKRMSGLVMMLPHGYEGQGPEHSSARLERYLQLCAQQNIQVTMPSTPAQIGLLLIRQMKRGVRKPLIIMTPKSLLRHPKAVSTWEDFSNQPFKRVLFDKALNESAQRIVFCSGKVYYDLQACVEEHDLKNVAIVRLEQLYPFPYEELGELEHRWSPDAELIWCQEEPINQGSWSFVRPKFKRAFQKKWLFYYAGRSASAAPAVGYMARHKSEQEMLVKQALGIIDNPYKETTHD